METNDKLGMGGEILKPRVSILDPEYTYTVPANQTAAGTADIMSHIIETYFHDVEGAYLQDRFAESLLKTCIEFGPIAVKEPENYDARANLMWASSHAINGMISYGTDVGWSVHPMEHELSAYYDITHGVGLSILTPRWMKHILSDETLGKFVDYGVNVWGIDSSLDKFEIANMAIEKTYDFFASIGRPMNLREVGIDEENLEVMAEFASKRELSAYYDITHGVGLSILTPRWMKHILSDETLGKFVDYGVNVWGIDSSLDKFEIANMAIEKTYDFFASIGRPMNLREVGIDEENLEVMAEFASKRGAKYGYVSLSKEDVLEIYKESL